MNFYKFLRRGAGLAAFYVIAFFCVMPAKADPVLLFTGGKLSGVTGINAGSFGTLDVQFQDGSCQSVFSGCNSLSDFTFTNQADAETASNALRTVLLGWSGVNNPANVFGCVGNAECSIVTPWGTTVNAVNTTIAATQNPPPKVDVAGSLLSPNFNYVGAFTSGIQSDITWAVWSVSAVPEPETYAMMLAGLGLVGAIARRRKAKQTV
jgi:hypothetical protein